MSVTAIKTIQYSLVAFPSGFIVFAVLLFIKAEKIVYFLLETSNFCHYYRGKKTAKKPQAEFG